MEGPGRNKDARGVTKMELHTFLLYELPCWKCHRQYHEMAAPSMRGYGLYARRPFHC